MKHQTRLAFAGLLSAIVLGAAACGGAGGGADGMEQGGTGKDGSGAAGGEKSAGMQDMDHSKMGQDPGGAAPGRLIKNGEYSDKRFIDEMVPHHQGAVKMAEVGLENAEHREIERLSENIISTQREEIDELKAIKHEEFGTSRVPMQMDQGQMEGMGMMEDPQSLADEKPFDKAFIKAMIPHHRSAIEMAEVAREESDNPRVKELAGNIIDAQEREISQMQTWREHWYPEG